MADARHLVRQWLETDAAFGVTEAPLKVRKKQRAATPALPLVARPPAPQTKPAQPPEAEHMHFAVRRAPERSAVPAVPQSPRAPATDSAPVAKKVIVMPPPPAGLITELSPLTRGQKETLLRKLQEQTLAASAQYINDIATKLVFGEGDPDAAIMFVGEGPGIEEDKTGRPFVGRSGQLLEKMINAMGFKREEVYIANVVKLRAAEWDEAAGRLKDRPPTPEEAARGLPVLHAQIEIIRPKVIVTLGAPAVKYVTSTTEGVSKIRGTWLSHRGLPVMPTYHPSFLLRAYTPENRKKVWGDLQLAMKKISG